MKLLREARPQKRVATNRDKMPTTKISIKSLTAMMRLAVIMNLSWGKAFRKEMRMSSRRDDSENENYLDNASIPRTTPYPRMNSKSLITMTAK